MEDLYICSCPPCSFQQLYHQISEASSTYIKRKWTLSSIPASPVLTPYTTQTNQNPLYQHHRKMALRAPSKKAATKVFSKTHRTRRQRKGQQLGLQQRIRNLPALPPTFRCWFCVGEKRLEEQVPNSRTAAICHNCHEHYSNIVPERDAADTQTAAAISSSFSPPTLPSRLPTTPARAHRVILSPPLRPAVVINPRIGLKKKIILILKASKKLDAPTSNEGPEEEKGKMKVKLRLTAPKKPGAPTSNERPEKKKKKVVRLGLTEPEKPLLFLGLPNRKEEKIFLMFPNPLNKRKG